MKDSVDNMEVSGGEPLNHVGNKILPFLREVLLADYSDGLTQLLLYWSGRLEHEINDKSLDSFSVRRVDLVGSVLGYGPVPLDVVLEGDGASNLMMRKTFREMFIQLVIALP